MSKGEEIARWLLLCRCPRLKREGGRECDLLFFCSSNMLGKVSALNWQCYVGIACFSCGYTIQRLFYPACILHRYPLLYNPTHSNLIWECAHVLIATKVHLRSDEHCILRGMGQFGVNHGDRFGKERKWGVERSMMNTKVCARSPIILEYSSKKFMSFSFFSTNHIPRVRANQSKAVL